MSRKTSRRASEGFVRALAILLGAVSGLTFALQALSADLDYGSYLAGRTGWHDFPTLNAFQPLHRGGSTGETAFVSKLNASGSGLIYSTYLGGTHGDVATGIAVDFEGNAYVTGETAEAIFRPRRMPSNPRRLSRFASERGFAVTRS